MREIEVKLYEIPESEIFNYIYEEGKKDLEKREPVKEIGGLLFGKIEERGKKVCLHIYKAVYCGKGSSGEVELNPEKMIEAIKRYPNFRVLGWWHTHPGYGLFLSEKDIRTQKSWQSLNPYVVAMVIDSLVVMGLSNQKEVYSFFRINEKEEVRRVSVV